jgi:hypothetical protein
MADVWLAPYLPLSSEVSVGPWRLIPFRRIASRHTRGRQVFNEVRRLRTAYSLKKGARASFGALVLPDGGRIGDELPRRAMRPLARALTAAVLDGNPSLLLNEEDEPNLGHVMASADNAVVYGHPLTGGPSYAISTGAMVRQLDLRHSSAGRRLPPITPPPELPTPLFSRFDDEYATATQRELVGESATARRVDRTIEWLALAWSNTTAISADARVLAFRAGFDVLLGGGSSTAKHRRALSNLLDESDAARRRHAWRGQNHSVELTDLEWWFQSFALLRNAIAHGDQIADDHWLFDDGKPHLHHADDVLRRAIKRKVADDLDEPDLLLDPFERALARAARSALGRLETDDDD